MPAARIHEAISREINKDYKMDDILLRIGSVAPDCWRNVDLNLGFADKYSTHFWDYRIKDGQANGYEEFYLKYYNDIKTPFYFGYLLHLIADQYWKTYVDTKYIVEKNGVKGIKLINGEFHDDDKVFKHLESLKMLKQLARIYDLGNLPIEKESIKDFNCNIEELNLSGLFGNTGTLNYVNTSFALVKDNEKSEIYDVNDIISYIKDTVEFIKKELVRLEKLKKENDKKIKIAIVIDEVNFEIKEVINKLFDKKYRVDLLLKKELKKHGHLKKTIVENLESKDISYNYLNFVSNSEIDCLKLYKYDILIDNDITYLKQAELDGIIPILYKTDNIDYKGYKTYNWSEIPYLIERIINDNKIN